MTINAGATHELVGVRCLCGSHSRTFSKTSNSCSFTIAVPLCGLSRSKTSLFSKGYKATGIYIIFRPILSSLFNEKQTIHTNKRTQTRTHTYTHILVYTGGCRYNATQYNAILRISLQWLRQKDIDQGLKTQKTPHTMPWRMSYGMSCVRIVKKICCFITAPHCMLPGETRPLPRKNRHKRELNSFFSEVAYNDKIQSRAIKTRRNNISYCIMHSNDSTKHKSDLNPQRHPISRHNGRVMECLLWVSCRKMMTL